jgi:hypothetical protein
MRRVIMTLCRSIASNVSALSLITRLRIPTEQPFGSVGDVEPSISRDVIFGATISSLPEKFNRTSAMPSHELAGDVFNRIILIVHNFQNSGLRCLLLYPKGET